MDIRRFFGPVSGSSKVLCNTKLQSEPVPPGNKAQSGSTPKSHLSKGNKTPKTSDRKLLAKNKAKSPALAKTAICTNRQSLESENDVEIIEDSDDEAASKKRCFTESENKKELVEPQNKSISGKISERFSKKPIESQSKNIYEKESDKKTIIPLPKTTNSSSKEFKNSDEKSVEIHKNISDKESKKSNKKSEEAPNKSTSLKESKKSGKKLVIAEDDEIFEDKIEKSSKNKHKQADTLSKGKKSTSQLVSISDEKVFTHSPGGRDERDREQQKTETDDSERGKKRTKRKQSNDNSSSLHVDSIDERTEKIKPTKKSHRIIISDSDEEDPVPKKKGEKRKKKPVILLEDSEEEKSPKKTSLDVFLAKTAVQVEKTPVHQEKAPDKKVPVNVADFFGSGTVHRSERNSVAEKRKASETLKVEVEFHGDDTFSKTLEQLDKQQAKRPKKDTSPVTEMTIEKGTSTPANKLSMKMKMEYPVSPIVCDKNSNLIVPETPVDKMPHNTDANMSASFTPVKDLGKKNKSEKSWTSSGETPDPVAPKSSPPKSHNTDANMSASGKDLGKVKNKSEKSWTSSGETSDPVAPKSSPPKDESSKGMTPKNWGAYRNFLNREGPRALGSKEIPTGKENCLEGLTFVITGVLESMERDESKSLIERYGGKVTGNVSSRTSYVVVGRDPGASKITKAEQFKTKQLDEDGLLGLIRTLPGKKSKYEEQAEQAAKKEFSSKKLSYTTLKKSDSDSTPSRCLQDDTSIVLPKLNLLPIKKQSASGASVEPTLLWVDKYKPTTLKQIIGQQGDRSNAQKLLHWLQQWHSNHEAGIKPAGKFGGRDDGAGFKAALLSGPPGIGKTTTAVLVCQEAGFSTVELNASDTRSKKNLKEDVMEALSNQTLVDYMDSHKGSIKGHNHCLIMDEVDGMAGNEDRGGLQELVQLIKTTKIPIICICNDRNSMKMRTLSNYCFDLRFQRPRLEQIKGAVMSIAFKEGIKISPPALQEIILASNQDIRQTIHNLSMWTADKKELSYDQAKSDAKSAQKDIRLGIFDVCRKIFAGGEETAGMTINDKSDLFFQDYSFVPLFVHENYISVTPYAARGDQLRHLSMLARSVDSICDGDLVDKQVRSLGNWNLLPMQAMFASVIPGELMRGSLTQIINFPQWLGKNSSTGKTDRLLQDLRTHMALEVSCDKRGLNMDYLPALRARLTEPLARLGTDGVQAVISLMDDYDIIKDDYDNILELTKWPNSKDPLAHLDSKTKAAFTRQYNKESHLIPYATGSVAKKKRGKGTVPIDEDLQMGEGEDGDGGTWQPASDNEEEDDIETDTMIKASKKPRIQSQGSKVNVASGSKGKGQGKSTKSQGKGGQSDGKGKGRR